MEKRYDKRVLGKKYIVTNDSRITNLNNNDIIIGNSGSGKTGGILYPSLRCANNESFVFVDAKALMSKLFKDELEKKGYEVKILSFIHPEESIGYNPLSNIKINKDGNIRYQDVVSLANALMPNLDKSEPIWEEDAKIVLQFLISFCLEKFDKQDWNMKSILELFHILVKSDGIQYFLDVCEGDTSSFALKKLLELQAMQRADKMYASVLSFASAALATYAYPEIQSLLTNQDIIDIAEIGKKKQAVFVQVSDTDRSYDTLVNVFISQIINVLIQIADSNEDGRLEIPCRIYLDDMAACCNIPDFAKTISVIRSRDLYVTVILQSMTQMYSIYGKYDALTILSCCDHVVYLNSNDLDSVDYICNRANKTRESILNMDRTKEYIFATGEKAVLIDKNPPYTDCGLE